jgi:hypothetical protein
VERGIVQEFRSSGVQEFRSSGVQEFRSSGVQEFRSSGVQGGADRKIASRKTAVVEILRSAQSRPMQAPELLNSSSFILVQSVSG